MSPAPTRPAPAFRAKANRAHLLRANYPSKKSARAKPRVPPRRPMCPHASSLTLRFVEDEVRSLGPNPGPDASWVMGLAFADVRGDLEDELAKAEERAPRSPRVREARALAEGR